MQDNCTTTSVIYKELDFMGYPGYRVGDDGSVWTRWQRKSLGKGHGSCRVLTDWKRATIHADDAGYLHVSLNCRGWTVHCLVLTAFIGPRPKGMLGCHYPHQDPSDNRLCNLMWGTLSQNMQHKRENGTWAGLENNPATKLTNEDVREIRRTYKRYVMTLDMLATKYNVSNVTIQKIVYNKNWKELT